MPPLDEPSTFAASLLGAFVAIHFAFRAFAARRSILGIPRSVAAGVHIGLNRVRGTARPVTEPLAAPLTGTPCAGWSYRIEDEWRRPSVWRWRRRDQWRTVAAESANGPFDLVDESGAIRVVTAGALVVGWRTLATITGTLDERLAAFAAPSDLPGATGRRRVTELVIPLDRPVEVLGTARVRADVPEPELAWDPEDGSLVVTTLDSAVHTSRRLARGVGLIAVALFLVGTTPLAIRPSDTEYWDAISDSGAWVPLLVGGTVGLLGAYWIRLVYNDLVELRGRVRRARSLVAVQLQRRHDLVPALADAAAAAASHEREVQSGSAGGRAPDLTAAARSRAVAEAVPDLASGEAFERLSHGVGDAEDRLALARRFLHDSITLYDDRRRSIPMRWIATPFGFGTEPGDP